MRFSVIIPTFQRTQVVTRNVLALERQERSDFEVIVVDDGSSDGTATALRQLDLPFPLTVMEQPNLGAGAARDAGAKGAIGEVLLFLDDDMEADSHLLAVHDTAHLDGADVVLGDLPLHPQSPRNLLSRGVAGWARERCERLAEPGAEISVSELLTGQLSISRQNYQRIGGFDASFTRDGMFGGEDTDFGYRVVRAGLRVVFAPAAISYQYYDVDPAEYLSRAREAGRSSHELRLKHPERASRFGRVADFKRRRDRWLLLPFVFAPGWVSWPLRASVAALARTGHQGPRLRTLFFAVRSMERMRGLRLARAASSTGQAVALAYHGVADLSDDAVLGRYGVPAHRFAWQLDSLASHGWTFVDLTAVLDALAGKGHLRPRSVLMTFDDGYADFLTAALPVLAGRGIPAVVFAVAGLTGATNVWDQQIGAGARSLMDGEDLMTVTRAGVDVGSHGMSHGSLASLDQAELEAEVQESAARLEELGLPRPRVFSYPYGESSPAAATALHRAGYLAGFTITPGAVHRGADHFALPRVQVDAADTPALLRLKLVTASWPDRWREPILRYALKLRRTRA